MRPEGEGIHPGASGERGDQGTGQALRVLQFLPSVESASGGPVRSTVAECRAVHAADARIETVWISTRHGLAPEWEEELRRSLPARMSLRLFPQVGRHTLNVSPSLLTWLWKHAREYHLLVLRSLLHPLTSACAWVARRRGLPYVVVPHGTLSEWAFHHRRTHLKRLYFHLVERRTLEGARGVRYTSEAERSQARRLSFSVPEDAVIPHPFESRRQAVASPDRDPEQVLFLARLDPKKGVGVLLAAVARARRARPGVRLVLAGSGSAAFERKVRALVRERGLEGAVELPGFVAGAEKERLLDRSSVFVLPSREENFGVAVAEAMDAGLPVIVSREVGIAPLVEELGAGRVVPRTPEALAAALLEILERASVAREMGRAGRRLVRERLAPDVVGSRVADLYRRCARRTP